jgi:hypothetical protein
MLVAEGGEPRQHRVDLDLAGDEGVEGLGVLSVRGGSSGAPWFVASFHTRSLCPDAYQLNKCMNSMIIGADMQGMSERQYAAHVGLSRGAIQKAKTAGTAGPACRWQHRCAGQRCAPGVDDRPLEAAPGGARTEAEARPRCGLVRRRRHAARKGLRRPGRGGGTTFLQAKTANEVLKAQERRSGCRS